MAELRINDEVLSYNNDKGTLEFSTVLTFLDRDPQRKEHFVKIKTDSGDQLILTRYHLVYRQEYDGRPSVTYAARILPGDKILTMRKSNQANATRSQNDLPKDDLSSGTLIASKVLAVHHVKSRGVYAPLTTTGNIVVNGVVASCYALVNDHQLAHRAFGPLRLLYRPLRWMHRWLGWVKETLTNVHLLRGAPVERSSSSDHGEGHLKVNETKVTGGKLTQVLLLNRHEDRRTETNRKHDEETNEDVQEDPVDEYTASFRGIHWYAAVLYYVFQSGLSSYMP